MDLLHPIIACTDNKAMGSAYYDAEAGRYVLLGYAILITFAGTLGKSICSSYSPYFFFLEGKFACDTFLKSACKYQKLH